MFYVKNLRVFKLLSLKVVVYRIVIKIVRIHINGIK